MQFFKYEYWVHTLLNIVTEVTFHTYDLYLMTARKKKLIDDINFLHESIK